MRGDRRIRSRILRESAPSCAAKSRHLFPVGEGEEDRSHSAKADDSIRCASAASMAPGTGSKTSVRRRDSPAFSGSFPRRSARSGPVGGEAGATAGQLAGKAVDGAPKCRDPTRREAPPVADGGYRVCTGHSFARGPSAAGSDRTARVVTSGRALPELPGVATPGAIAIVRCAANVHGRVATRERYDLVVAVVIIRDP